MLAITPISNQLQNQKAQAKQNISFGNAPIKFRKLSSETIAQAMGGKFQFGERMSRCSDYRITDHFNKSGLDAHVTGNIGDALEQFRNWSENLGSYGMYPSHGALAVLTPKGLTPEQSVFTADTFRRDIMLGMGRNVESAVKRMVQYTANAGDFLIAVLRKGTQKNIDVKIPAGTTDIIRLLEANGLKAKAYETDGLVGGARDYKLHDGLDLVLSNPTLEKLGRLTAFHPNPKFSHNSSWFMPPYVEIGFDKNADKTEVGNTLKQKLNEELKQWIDKDGTIHFKLDAGPFPVSAERIPNPLRGYGTGPM